MDDHWVEPSRQLRTSEALKLKWIDTIQRCNFGAAWGWRLPDGRVPFCFDVDVDGDHEGAATMQHLESQGKTFPPTLRFSTGGGGQHIIVALPAGSTVGCSKPLPGIDIKGRGGQSVLPYSRSWKGEYALLEDAPIADAPQWLIELLESSKVTDYVYADAKNLKAREDLSEEEIQACDAEESKLIARAIRKLKELASVPPGREPSWPVTVWGQSKDLMRLVNSPWAKLTEQDVFDIVCEHAPQDDGFGLAEIEAKIHYAKSSVRGEGVQMPVVRTETTPMDHDPSEFFDKSKNPKLLTKTLSETVLEMGPLGLGQDSRFWYYDECGVWKPDREAGGVINKRVATLLGDKYIQGHESNVRKFLPGFIPAVDCSPVSGFINFTNGMLNWRTLELMSHDPKYMSTVQLPVAWNPDAETYWFDKFVDSIMPNDSVDLLWQVLGYLLYNGNPLQKAFLFIGDGANGKGTLIRAISKVIGIENISNVTLDSLSERPFAGAELYGKVANIAGDIDATYQKRTAKFKQITGEDQVEAERKFRDPFRFTPWATNVFSANEYFGVADTSHGFVRRWVIVPFPNTFSASSDPKMIDLMMEETEGIAAKAVQALGPLMARKEFSETDSARNAMAEFVQHINPISRWIEEECGGPETLRGLLYDQYQRWCEVEGHMALGRNKFYAKLKQMGYQQVVVPRGRVFEGLGLKGSN